MDMEKLIEYTIGFGDGLTDVGIDYLDDVFNTKDKPVLKKASTWGHIGLGAALVAADYMGFFRGKSSTIAAVIAGRHIGAGVGKIVKAVAEGEPVWGEKKSEVTVTFEELEKGSLEIEETKEETKEETTETVEELPGQAL